jgi:hypothetical protein
MLDRARDVIKAIHGLEITKALQQAARTDFDRIYSFVEHRSR